MKIITRLNFQFAFVILAAWFTLCVLPVIWWNQTSAADEITASQPSPARIEGEPALYFGVINCGKEWMWVVLTNGRTFRISPDRHPDDMKAFAKQLQGVRHDIVELPCIGSL